MIKKTIHFDWLDKYPQSDTEDGINTITLCSDGIKAEGRATKIYLDPDQAVNDYEKQLKKILKGKKKIIWRMRPELRSEMFQETIIKKNFIKTGGIAEGHFVVSRIKNS